MMFSKKIIDWYQINKRDLPWRRTKDPYTIWLSEIILQQTRVAQGLPYYQRFIEAFPNLKKLATTSEQDVLKLWQGLGYYSRARNLHATARFIHNDLKGIFPSKYEDLLKMKGIGDYTAAAIASFCFDENKPVLDGNVYRVLARYFGIHSPINTSLAKKEFKTLATKLINAEKPGLYNQAIMEFGALQCTPTQPDCSICPLNDSCVALQKEWVNILPKKEKKLKIRKRYFNYLIIETEEERTYVEKREGKGIWQNLYEFPLIETTNSIDFNAMLENSNFNAFTSNQNFDIQLLTKVDIVHKLTHQHLFIKFWLLEMPKFNKRTISWESLLALPFPIVIYNFVEEFVSSRTGIK